MKLTEKIMDAINGYVVYEKADTFAIHIAIDKVLAAHPPEGLHTTEQVLEAAKWAYANSDCGECYLDQLRARLAPPKSAPDPAVEAVREFIFVHMQSISGQPMASIYLSDERINEIVTLVREKDKEKSHE